MTSAPKIFPCLFLVGRQVKHFPISLKSEFKSDSYVACNLQYSAEQKKTFEFSGLVLGSVQKKNKVHFPLLSLNKRKNSCRAFFLLGGIRV